MGVLNVTPDSFSDGGRWFKPNAAVKHGVAMADAGAAFIDVGGESTRPGADPVPVEEELRRVIPVIERLAPKIDAPISIDTRKPEVALAALDAGAAIINDTLGEEGVDVAQTAASTGAAVIVMHSRGTPATMRDLTVYDDVTDHVSRFLSDRAYALRNLGVPADGIVLDPGFGFAKTPDQNLELLARFEELTGLGFPVLAGTSRKSFIGAVLDVKEDERLEGTLATVVWAVVKGASIVRVHDVVPAMRAVRMTEAIIRGKGAS